MASALTNDTLLLQEQEHSLEAELINYLTDGQKFMKNYDLNQEKAIEKIMKLAKIEALTRENKSTCVNMHFNSGAYFHTALVFSKQIQVDGEFKNDHMKIKCTRKESRTDRKNRDIETLVYFDTEDMNQAQSQVNFHMYHSLMKITVQGNGVFCFVDKFLMPYFEQAIKSSEELIRKTNAVIQIKGSKPKFEFQPPGKRKRVIKPSEMQQCNMCPEVFF